MSKVYDYVTEKILALLDKGEVPWNKPWDAMPMNYVTHRPYRGINVFFLAAQGYGSPYWMTFRQVSQLGGKVKTGAKSTMVVFWNWVEGKEVSASGKREKFPILRYYNVFNWEQTEGIPEKVKAKGEIPSAEKVIADSPVRPIETKGTIAAYCPALDSITMPDRGTFKSIEEFYNTKFHEMGHATGHKSRLNRDLDGLFGDHSYSKEELIAEMTAAFLSSHCGIEGKTVENSAAYIANWRNKISRDNKLVVQAAAAAQKAADCILGKKFEDTKEESTEE